MNCIITINMFIIMHAILSLLFIIVILYYQYHYIIIIIIIIIIVILIIIRRSSSTYVRESHLAIVVTLVLVLVLPVFVLVVKYGDTFLAVYADGRKYTRSPLEDSPLFGPSPWKILATTYEQKYF